MTNGNRWRAGLPDMPAVRALAVHPQKPEIVYAGTQSGPYRSADRGEHWEKVELPDHGLPVWSVLFHPHDPDVILVGYENCEIYRSDDAGERWTRLPVSVRFPEITTAPGANPGKARLDARRQREPARSPLRRDRGRRHDPLDRWRRALGESEPRPIRQRRHGRYARRAGEPVAARASVFGIARAGMFRSNDGGDHWKHVPLEPLNPKGYIYCRDIREVPGNPRHLWVAAGAGFQSDAGTLLHSRDGGDSWGRVDIGAPVPHTMFKIAFDERRPARMSAATNGGEVYSASTAARPGPPLCRRPAASRSTRSPAAESVKQPWKEPETWQRFWSGKR